MKKALLLRSTVLAVGASLLAMQSWGVESSSASVARPTDRIIVKYADSASERAVLANNRLAKLLGVKTLKSRVMANGARVLELGERRDIKDILKLVAKVSKLNGVEYAEPDYIMTAQAVPNDPLLSKQWHYYEPKGGLNLPEAWDITTGSPNVTVAVIDTGIVPHQDLAENLVPGYDFISDADDSNDGDGRDADAFDSGDYAKRGDCYNGWFRKIPKEDSDSSWHGTHVAGTIAAVSNNGTGVAGVNWNASVQPIRVLGRCGGYTSDITDGMLWAAGYSVPGIPDNRTPAKVLNMSLGGGGACSSAYQDAINKVRKAGATIVVAAGNDDDDVTQYSPASCTGAVTVASNNREGALSYYSNYGESVDVTAPGGETKPDKPNGILSTLNAGAEEPEGDVYEYYQGTSMAAPHVAGVAALMYSVNPDLTPVQVETILEQTARSFPKADSRQCSTKSCGAGIVDAAAAVKAAQNLN